MAHEQIFELFLDNYKLKFSDIEKKLQTRSNKLAYHLEQMQKDGLLQKQGTLYSLTREGEKRIPHFEKGKAPLPVILVAPVRRGKVLLVQRTKRPYKDYWGLPGGRMLADETVQGACERKLREHGVEGSYESLNAIAHELVKDEDLKHNFILFFTKAKVKSPDGKWFSLNKLPEKIIPSDLWLLKNKLDANIDVPLFTIHDKDGELSLE
jgi:ADP-ribose pyrophosphatase YjhB (NUDIX family)